MRRTRLTAGLVIVAAVAAGGCGTGDRARSEPITSLPLSSTTVSATPSDAVAPQTTPGSVDPVAVRATSTTTTPSSVPAPPEAPNGEDVDAVLAEIDAQLAGLDELLNQAAAALAAEEEEILP